MELKLMQLRKNAGYKSRDDFAKALGVKPRTYAAWETGERRLKLEDACMIADELDCTLDELAGRYKYVGSYADPRQRSINDDFAKLDEPSKDSAAAAMRGMAIACAQEVGPEEAEDSSVEEVA